MCVISPKTQTNIIRPFMGAIMDKVKEEAIHLIIVIICAIVHGIILMTGK